MLILYLKNNFTAHGLNYSCQQGFIYKTKIARRNDNHPKKVQVHYIYNSKCMHTVQMLTCINSIVESHLLHDVQDLPFHHQLLLLDYFFHQGNFFLHPLQQGSFYFDKLHSCFLDLSQYFQSHCK